MELEVQEAPSFKRWGLAQRRTILSQHLELGFSISSLARKYGIHAATLYQWKRDHMSKKVQKRNEPSVTELLEELEKIRKENKHLKTALAEVSVDKSILKDALEVFKKKELKKRSKLPKRSSK